MGKISLASGHGYGVHDWDGQGYGVCIASGVGLLGLWASSVKCVDLKMRIGKEFTNTLHIGFGVHDAHENGSVQTLQSMVKME